MSRHVWAEEELLTLRELYPDRPTGEIATLLRQPLRKVYKAASGLGLKKTEDYIQDPANRCRLLPGSTIGRESRFPKGHVPANKGLRRPGYYAGRMRETQFKKGERTGIAARNWVPVGTILPDSDGYLRIKVRDAVHGKEATGFGNSKVWPMYNRWLWERDRGPIPPKHLVVFKDGRRENCAIENLELRSMADNARRNAMWNRFPRELTHAIILNGALKRKLRRLSGQEQDRRPSRPPVRNSRSAEGPRPADGS